MTQGVDERFVRAAVRLGFLSAATADRLTAAHAGEAPDRPLADWLIALGALTAAQRIEVDRELLQSSSARTLVDSPGSHPETPSTRGGSEAKTVLRAPVRDGTRSAAAETHPRDGRASFAAGLSRLGKYEILEELGRGGMGVVYRARDLALNREVALKTALLGGSGSPAAIQRLLQEARTSAALDHPAIVPIHDSGEEDGVPWFAMAYVRGKTLDRIWRDEATPNLRERVRLILEVARAVAHAHERRVIHRDLKPSNVLLDADGHVHVLDFGLARRLDDGVRLTMTGQMIGTPQYMPPEQIDGERDRIGPASDVYALGALLFEATTGRAPFIGATPAEIVLAALTQDPPSPRSLSPRVPVDLETVCLRALEKEPERRYLHAGEFADDLDRWLRGEAIQARPVGRGTLLIRRAWRNKTRSAVLAVLILAALWGAWETLSSRRLQERVRSDLRQRAGTYLSTALDLRRQGLPMPRIQADLRPKMLAAVREAEAQEPGRAEPAYFEGRMARAVLAFDEALVAQDRALAREPGFLPSRYERAILLSRKRLSLLDDLRQRAAHEAIRRLTPPGADATGAPDPQAVSIPGNDELEEADPEARRLRDRILEDLRILEAGMSARTGPSPASPETPSTGDGTPDLRPAHLACARGFALACRNASREDRQEARELLRAALAEDPQLEEAVEAWGAVEESESRWREALDVFTRGLEHDRGFTPFWISRARVLLKRGHEISLRGEDPEPDFAAAEADFRKALALDPGHVETWNYLGQLETKRASWLEDRNGDADGAMSRAIAAFDCAVEREPDNPHHLLKRGIARMNWGAIWKGRGQEPVEHYRAAEEDLSRALRAYPESAEYWSALAATHGNWANWLHQRGENSDELYARATEEMDRAVACNPRLASAWTTRAQVCSSWALARKSRGGDPVPLYARAESDFRRGLGLAPDSFLEWAYLGDLLMNWALLDAARREDAGPRFERAVEAHRRSLQVNPESAGGWRSLGLTLVNWAMYRKERGEDPGPVFEQARDALAEALRRNPGDPNGWLRRAALWINWGNHLSETGGEPEALWMEGLSDLIKARELGPGLAEPWLAEAKARLALGLRAQKADRDPAGEFERALAAAGECLSRDRSQVEALLLRTEVRLYLSFTRQKRGEDVAPLYLASLADLERIEQIHPAHAVAAFQRGLLCARMEVWGEAVAAYERAFELDSAREKSAAGFLKAARREFARITALPPPLRILQSAQDSLKLGRYHQSREEYGEYLRLAEEAARTLPQAERDRLFSTRHVEYAHFNRACVLAVLSTGRKNPIDDPRPIPEAQEYRDAAFLHLEACLNSTPRERKAVETDPDLVRLRDDPRWEALLGRLK